MVQTKLQGKFVLKKPLVVLFAFALVAAPAVSARGASNTINSNSWEAIPGNISGVGLGSGAYGLDGTEFSISLHGENNFDEYECGGAFVDETEPDGDWNLACAQSENSNLVGIDWDGSVKVFSGEFGGLVARQVVTLENITENDIIIDYEYYLDTEETQIDFEDANGTVGTPDGDFIVDDGETWWVGANDNAALKAVAFDNDGFARGDGNAFAVDEGFGILAADTIIDEEGFDEFYVWNDAGVTIPAGESLSFAYFYFSIGALDSGSTSAVSMTDVAFNAQMNSLFGDSNDRLTNPRLTEGLSGAPYNWGTSDGNDDEGLADTGGLDANFIAIGGAVILAAGVGLFASRRNRTVA